MVIKHYFNNWWLGKKIIEKISCESSPFTWSISRWYASLPTIFIIKFPATIILHDGTNNCVNESSCVVLDKIHNLKAFIQNSLPQCKVIISNVISRTDDGKASRTVEGLNNHLNSFKRDIVDNSTIGKECLG